MQLNKFTDFGLRLLMLLSQPGNDLMTIAQAAHILKISENHLIKITHFMVKQGWIISTRGKGGGIRIAESTYNLPLGEILRILENDTAVVNCNEPACVLRFSCTLKSLLDQALQQFYQYLNQFTLKNTLQDSIHSTLHKSEIMERLIPVLEIETSTK